MKNRNKGFSYIELLLVLAIMAIMIGLITLSIGLISRTNVNRGAETLTSTINQARTTSMARGNNNGQIEISFDGSKYYYYVGDLLSPDKEELKEEFISSPAVVTYTLENNLTTQIPVTTTNPLKLSFVQSSGELQPSSGPGTPCCNSITITNGDKSATVKIYPATGKCELVY